MQTTKMIEARQFRRITTSRYEVVFKDEHDERHQVYFMVLATSPEEAKQRAVRLLPPGSWQHSATQRPFVV